MIDLNIDTSAISTSDRLRSSINRAETRYDAERGWILFWLGLAAIGVAMLCSVPPAMEHLEGWRGKTLNPVDRWTHLALLTSLVQAAVAIYALQLPDWSTSWFNSLATTIVAAIYAMGLSLTMFADQEHQLVRELGLLDESFNGTAQRWCFLVTCLTLLLAYCYGRFSLRWYSMEKQLSEARGGTAQHLADSPSR